MTKSNDSINGKTVCERCTQPGTIDVGGRLYCAVCAPAAGEKRASTSDSFKESIEELTQFHGE